MKIIRNPLSILSFFLASTLCSSLVLADSSDIYFGLDLLKTNYSTQERYGRNIFKKNPIALNAFVGYELPNNFLLEAGYELTSKKGRSDRIGGGDYYPGDPIANANNAWGDYDSKIKISHPYLSAGMHASFYPNADFFVLAGVSVTKVKASLEQTADFQGIIVHNLTPAEVAASRRNFSKSKITPMIKLGVNYAFTDNFAFRLTGTWRKLNNFKCKTDTPGSIAEIRLKNGYSVGVGLSYSL